MEWETVESTLPILEGNDLRYNHFEVRCNCERDDKLCDGMILQDDAEVPEVKEVQEDKEVTEDKENPIDTEVTATEPDISIVENEVGTIGDQDENVNNKRRAFEEDTLEGRDWRNTSVFPFVNFLRVYKRGLPPKSNIHMIARQARRVWREMTHIRKQPFLKQAERAKLRGHKV